MDIRVIQNEQISIFIHGITARLLIYVGGGEIVINWTEFWFKLIYFKQKQNKKQRGKIDRLCQGLMRFLPNLWMDILEAEKSGTLNRKNSIFSPGRTI
jgi:hypothetical protein